MIPNNASPTKDNKPATGIAREGVGARLEWMVWENLSKAVGDLCAKT